MLPSKSSKRSRTSSNASANSHDSDVEEVAGPLSQSTQEASQDKTKRIRFNKRFKTDEKTDEEILAAQRETWKSTVYEHFRPPKIVVVKGETKYQFVCKSHPSSTPIVRARHDDSTSNLNRHMQSCTGRIAPAGSAINDFAHGSTYTRAGFRFKIDMWIARRYRPFKIVEDPELQEAFKMLYTKCEIPSRTTVSRDIKEIFNISQGSISAKLKAYNGRLHLCIDGWTSPNVISFLGVTVHYVKDGKMQSFILDFIKLTENHTGVYIASQLQKCLVAYGIEKMILGITADNASNNDVALAELGEALCGANGSQTQIRCFAHVMNLVLKAIVIVFKSTKKAKSTGAGAAADSDDFDNINEEAAAAYSELDEADSARTDGDGGEDEWEFDETRDADDDREIEEIIAEMEAEDALTPEEERLGRFAVSKLVALALRVFHSPSIREDFRLCCTNAGIEPREMIRDVPTRWNSLSACVTRALYLRPAIDRLLVLSKYDKRGKQGLSRYRESTEEWKILAELEPLLSLFLKATHRVSQSDTPLLHEVIPLIDILTAKLEAYAANRVLHRVVRIAATRGLRVMHKYYSKTDDSIMYRLAMLLHPRFKQEYFRSQKWEEAWIATAVEIATEQWTTYYKPQETVSAENSQTDVTTTNEFAALDNWNLSTVTDALEEYLNTPTVKSCADPIQYWTVQAAAGNTALARMALDFLSAPATSTDMERGFSRGGLTVSKRRHQLSDESTRAATVIGSWADIPGLIPANDIINVFKNKSKRSAAAERSSSTATVTAVNDDNVVIVDTDTESN